MSTLPSEMTAIEITKPGGPEVLKPVPLPLPAPGYGEVLIRVAAAGINRADVMQRQGNYPPPPGAPQTPGLEVAGEVAAVGPGVSELGPGDGVCALVTGGGYAQYCVAPVGQCLPIPAGLSKVDAAGLPETCFTVWSHVFQDGRLRGGERFLVHGGSSGIGTTAIQLASAFGARVFATAGSEDKCRACEALGAERGINYRSEDFADVVMALTGGAGVDLILDMVGGDYISRNIAILAHEGRLSQVAFLQGPKDPAFSLAPVLMKRLTLTGSSLRPRSVEAKTKIGAELRQQVWPLLETGAIHPVVDSTYALADAGEAHARMESSDHIGKIILTVD